MAASRVSANRARPLNEPGLFKDFLILQEWSSLAFWENAQLNAELIQRRASPPRNLQIEAIGG
jgi:hypothetical protein